MGTYVVTGAGSGMGAATTARLRGAGHTVIGVDVRGADVTADLGTVEGRAAAVDAVRNRAGTALDGLATFAGIGGRVDRPASVLVSVNYFGTVVLLEQLRPLLAAAERPAAVAISSNSTSCQPGYSLELVDALLAGDEDAARRLADETGPSVDAYPATKLAVARWVRRHAPTEDWAGAGICLNAIAPGMVETPMVEEGRRDPVSGPGIAQFRVPLGPAQPDQLAAVAEFLLGPDARFFCGSVIFCDGGTDAQFRADDWPARWQVPTS